MIWLLFLLMVLYFFIAFVLTEFDLLSPWVLLSLMFILSIVFIIPNIWNWEIDLSIYTILTITLGFFSFGFGEMNIRLISKQNSYDIKKNKNTKKWCPIIINKKILIFSIIIMTIVTYYYYQQVLRFAYAAGYDKGTAFSFIRFARIATISEIKNTVSTNKLLGQFVILSYSYSHLILYVLLYNIILCNFKKNIILHIFPIVIYLVQVILSGGRTGFLYIVSSSLIIGMILHQIKFNWKKNIYYKYLILGFFIFPATLGVFFLLGSLTGKTSIFNFYETLSVYIGSSIVALDNFLESGIRNNSKIFGGNTLFGIYDFLRRLGFDIPYLNKAAEFTKVGNFKTNIYTSYMRYIKDFTFFGLIIIEFFLGSLFSLIYLIIKRNGPSILILIYSIAFQVILEKPIEERFFMNLISVGYIIRFFYIIVLYHLLVRINWE